jgi:hypothetical protein
MKNRDYTAVKQRLVRKYQEITEELAAIPPGDRTSTMNDGRVIRSPKREALLEQLEAVQRMRREYRALCQPSSGRRR